MSRNTSKKTLDLDNKPFIQTHHHKKGGKYELLMVAIATDKIIEGETLAIYRGPEGIAHARPERLFNEKERFAFVGEKIAVPEVPEGRSLKTKVKDAKPAAEEAGHTAEEDAK